MPRLTFELRNQIIEICVTGMLSRDILVQCSKIYDKSLISMKEHITSLMIYLAIVGPKNTPNTKMKLWWVDTHGKNFCRHHRQSEISTSHLTLFGDSWKQAYTDADILMSDKTSQFTQEAHLYRSINWFVCFLPPCDSVLFSCKTKLQFFFSFADGRLRFGDETMNVTAISESWRWIVLVTEASRFEQWEAYINAPRLL